MDKLEIKQDSFIQQIQYFIPMEIDLYVVPARLGIWYRTNVNVEAWFENDHFQNCVYF